jgi:hypothetical protein
VPGRGAFARVAQVILPRIWDGATDFVAET